VKPAKRRRASAKPKRRDGHYPAAPRSLPRALRGCVVGLGVNHAILAQFQGRTPGERLRAECAARLTLRALQVLCSAKFCGVCGCVDSHACPGGCSWLGDEERHELAGLVSPPASPLSSAEDLYPFPFYGNLCSRCARALLESAPVTRTTANARGRFLHNLQARIPNEAAASRIAAGGEP
jgi:hypothetical protein